MFLQNELGTYQWLKESKTGTFIPRELENSSCRLLRSKLDYYRHPERYVVYLRRLQAKQVSNETIDGHECFVFVLDKIKGMTEGRIWLWVE